MAAERAVLLSIKPNFATAILRQEKTVELRRTRVHAPAGSRVLLYSSTPVRSVVGVATLAAVEEQSPAELWETAQHRCGVDRAEFDAYFHGAARAFGLHLTDPVQLADPVPLAALRQNVGVEPPQSFRYLSDAQATWLIGATGPVSTPEAAASGPHPGIKSPLEWMAAFVAAAASGGIRRILLPVKSATWPHNPAS